MLNQSMFVRSVEETKATPKIFEGVVSPHVFLQVGVLNATDGANRTGEGLLSSVREKMSL